MSRIAARFAELKNTQRKGLIPFITAGDPGPQLTVTLMHALAQSGADIIELGVPFSDPVADGPIIQQSSERALKRGVTLSHVLDYVREFRTRDAQTPVILMGYANPIEHMGTAHFVDTAQRVGVDGVLVVDYPPEEATEFAHRLQRASIDPIFLLAPTSPAARIATLDRK